MTAMRLKKYEYAKKSKWLDDFAVLNILES